jgi:uncharacterized protein
MAEKGAMTVKEAGAKGGRATKAKFKDTTFYQDIGHAGGTETMRRHGLPFYEKIGKKGGQRVKQLVAQAKKAQAK